jgi:hypothetical protein
LVVMTARMIEDAEHRLHELRQDEWSCIALAAVAMALALGASVVNPAFAIPFFLGGLTVALRSGHAFFERADLAHKLMLERSAHTIPEIRRRAEQAATMESRRVLAAAVRRRLEPVPGYRVAGRVAAVAGELESLAGELDDEQLLLDPVCAIQCADLLNAYEANPLYDDLLPEEDAWARIRQIRAGFRPRRGG